MIPAEVVCGRRKGQLRNPPSSSHLQTTTTHEDDVPEGTGGEEEVDPGLDLGELDVEAGGDDSALVDAAVELDNDLARAVVILWKFAISSNTIARIARTTHDLLELLDVACKGGTKIGVSSLFARTIIVSPCFCSPPIMPAPLPQLLLPHSKK